MIFKGNENGIAEGGEIKQAFVGVEGVAKEAYKIFVGDENGKAQLLYLNDTPPETAVTVSSLEEFYEQATADPYGYYVLAEGSYSIPRSATDTWQPIEDFYGTLCGAGETYLYAGAPLIRNNYGRIRHIGFHFSTVHSDMGGNFITNNYGHITHCMFLISQYSDAPAIGTHKTGGIIDNCDVMLCDKLCNNAGDHTTAPLMNVLEKGAYVCYCGICIHTTYDYDLKRDPTGKFYKEYYVKKMRYFMAQNPYEGYADDPDVRKYCFNNYGNIETTLNGIDGSKDFQFPLMKSISSETKPYGLRSIPSAFDIISEWRGPKNTLTALNCLQGLTTHYSFYYKSCNS